MIAGWPPPKARGRAGRVGVRGQKAVFERSHLAQAEPMRNGWAAMRRRGLGLLSKSSIARLSRAAFDVNQRIITFDAWVAGEDTGLPRPPVRANPVHCWHLKRTGTQEPF